MESAIGIIWGVGKRPRDLKRVGVSRAQALGGKLGASPVAFLLHTEEQHLLTLALQEDAAQQLLTDLCVALGREMPVPVARPVREKKT